MITPIDSCLRINAITVSNKESEIPKKEETPPVTTATNDTEAFIYAPTDAEE